MGKLVLLDDDGKEVVSMPTNPLVDKDATRIELVMHEQLAKTYLFADHNSRFYYENEWRSYEKQVVLYAKMIARETGVMDAGLVMNPDCLTCTVPFATYYGTRDTTGISFVAMFDKVPLSILMVTLERLSEMLAKKKLVAVEFSLQKKGAQKRSLVFPTEYVRDDHRNEVRKLKSFDTPRSKSLLANAAGNKDYTINISISMEVDGKLGDKPREEGE